MNCNSSLERASTVASLFEVSECVSCLFQSVNFEILDSDPGGHKILPFFFIHVFFSLYFSQSKHFAAKSTLHNGEETERFAGK